MFGERLRMLRRERDLTQKQLADLLHIARSTIAGYERGGKEPDNERLKQIANFFGVSVDFMIGASNDRNAGTSFAVPEAAEIIEALPDLSPDKLNRLLGYVEALKALPDDAENITIAEKHA